MPFGSDILDTGTETDASDIQADIALLPALAEGVNARVKTFSVGLGNGVRIWVSFAHFGH